MQYPPVNFGLLRDLLTVAGVEDEDEAAKCLRSVLTQLALYEPSQERDKVVGLVEMALLAPRITPTAIQAINDWAVDTATKQSHEQMRAEIKRRVGGQAGGKKRKADYAVVEHIGPGKSLFDVRGAGRDICFCLRSISLRGVDFNGVWLTFSAICGHQKTLLIGSLVR